MLLTLAVGLLLQSPQEDMKAWVDRGYDRDQPNSCVISGTTELSAKEAWATATSHAVEAQREQIGARAADQAAAQSPGWLPGFVLDRVVRRWTGEQIRRHRLKVLDRELRVRDHGFGNSFQAFLLLDRVDPQSATSSRSLAEQLRREQKRFVVKCVGTLGWWGVLGIFVLWIDRLTRGYMTGRLYTVGAALGISAPILLVIL